MKRHNYTVYMGNVRCCFYLNLFAILYKVKIRRKKTQGEKKGDHEMVIRKLISVIAAAVTGAAVLCTPFGAGAENIRGDVNGDGKVNVRDAAYIASSIVSNRELSDNADYNGDGHKNIRDAAAIAASIISQKYSYADEMLRLVNEERAKCGAKPLVLNMTMMDMANIRAGESAGKFSHTRPDGREFWTVFDEHFVDYTLAGENIAGGCPDAETAVREWVKSEDHYKNMVDPLYTQTGIGFYYDENSPFGYYWVQLFREP